MSDPIALLPAAAGRVDDVVAAVPEQGWAARSPCTRWTVRDVLNHLTYEHLWAPHLLRGETLEQVGDRYDGDVLGDGPRGRWAQAIAGSLAIWSVVDRRLRVHTSMGRIPVVEYAHQTLVDLTVHGWDLAAGAGVGYRPDDAAVTACLDYEAPRVRIDGLPGIFRPAVATAATGAMDRLLALLGRDPAWSVAD